MNKTAAIAILLIALLTASTVFNVYLFSQNSAFIDDRNGANSKLEMASIMTTVRTQVDASLSQLDSNIAYACRQLSAVDLQGAEARAILANLTASNPFIINSATSNADDILLAVEPSQYSGIEGEDISVQEQNVKMQFTMRPAMSDMILLVEGFYGAVMVAPIFNSNNTFIGSLSIVIQPRELLKAVIEPAIAGTLYSMWSMQVNGTLLYDPDPTQQGKNLFTDPIYVDYPTVQEFTHQVANQQAGYGTYTYHENTVAGKIVNKEAYWATAGIYGTEWRLVILHVLEK